jgi:hypothetical protein
LRLLSLSIDPIDLLALADCSCVHVLWTTHKVCKSRPGAVSVAPETLIAATSDQIDLAKFGADMFGARCALLELLRPDSTRSKNSTVRSPMAAPSLSTPAAAASISAVTWRHVRRSRRSTGRCCMSVRTSASVAGTITSGIRSGCGSGRGQFCALTQRWRTRSGYWRRRFHRI